MNAIVPATPHLADEQLDLVRRTIAKDATPDELALFIDDCQRRGCHPLDRLIHFTKRQGKYTPITSIDFMRSRAADSGEYAGNDDPVFIEDGKSPNPTQATVTVYKMVQGARCGFTATARWAEYFPGEAQGWAWKKMPHIMLGKCAEALALRKAFPQQLAGLYAAEEMDQAGRTTTQSKQKVITGELKECKAFESCSIAKIGKEKIVITDNGHDSLLVNLASGSKPHEVSVEVETKSGPKGKYLELVRILSIDGKEYLQAALEASVEAVTGEPVGVDTPADLEGVPF